MNFPLITSLIPPKSSHKTLQFKTKIIRKLKTTHGISTNSMNDCFQKDFLTLLRAEFFLSNLKFLPKSLLYVEKSHSFQSPKHRGKAKIFLITLHNLICSKGLYILSNLSWSVFTKDHGSFVSINLLSWSLAISIEETLDKMVGTYISFIENYTIIHKKRWLIGGATLQIHNPWTLFYMRLINPSIQRDSASPCHNPRIGMIWPIGLTLLRIEKVAVET